MTFKEIIEDNCDRNCKNQWWPRFAYHYTDIENALTIIERHMLFSRTLAIEEKVMVNDNANTNVIQNTGDAVNFVRQLSISSFSGISISACLYRFSRSGFDIFPLE